MNDKINEKDLKDQDLITSDGYKNRSTADLKEKFINDYSMKMGWDKENLTDEQISEIHSQKGYKCPGMVCD